MMVEPTAEQAEQCCIVQHEILENIERLRVEGIDLRIILSGLAAATASCVLHAYGASEVSIWFAKQSALTHHLSNPH